MTVWGETEDGGVMGEREKSEEVVEGGDKHDFGGILMGFANVDEYEWEGGEGERDRSLLVSLLLLSSDSMTRSRILFCCRKDRRRVVYESLESDVGPAGVKGVPVDIWGRRLMVRAPSKAPGVRYQEANKSNNNNKDGFAQTRFAWVSRSKNRHAESGCSNTE
ncbi:MAG: hypothetical protein Q9177_006461, partial [Variospora cf. flavescens]